LPDFGCRKAEQTAEKTARLAGPRVPESWRTAEKSVINGGHGRPAGCLLPVSFLGKDKEMAAINVSEAIKIIHDCAVLYEENLSNNNVMFVTAVDSKASYFEALFRPENYLHLTGVDTGLEAKLFFKSALSHKLSPSQISLKKAGYSEMKLEILPRLMSIHTVARMVGDYDNSRPLLIADKFAGTVTMAMGFEYAGGHYVPNTAMKMDIRDITLQATRRRIVAIFVKPRSAALYKHLTYIAKGMTIDDGLFASVFQEKVEAEGLTASFTIPRKVSE
jgi:hypothetical protein